MIRDAIGIEQQVSPGCASNTTSSYCRESSSPSGTPSTRTFRISPSRQIIGGSAPAFAITNWRVAGSHEKHQQRNIARLYLALGQRLVERDHQTSRIPPSPPQNSQQAADQAAIKRRCGALAAHVAEGDDALSAGLLQNVVDVA